jgi:hypothetical protein
MILEVTFNESFGRLGKKFKGGETVGQFQFRLTAIQVNGALKNHCSMHTEWLVRVPEERSLRGSPLVFYCE